MNAPSARVNSYAKDGSRRFAYNPPDAPVYAPHSYRGPVADPARVDEGVGWAAAGDAVRAPYVQHADDDWGQAGALVRLVMDDAARDRFVGNLVGHLLNGVREPVLSRAFTSMSTIDDELGKRIENSYRSWQDAVAPTTGEEPDHTR